MDCIRLEYEFKRKGLSYSEICDIIGISRTTLYMKMKGKSEFTLGELQRIADLIGVDAMTSIFFAKEVS